MSSLFALELGVANSTWALSALTVTMHKTFGGSLIWTWLLHPLWVPISMLLAPVLFIADVLVAVPRAFMSWCFLAVSFLVFYPGAWLAAVASEVASSSASISPTLIWRHFIVRPAVALTQVPIANPMAVAMLFSLLVTALSSPQPPSLSLPSLWNDLPNFEITRGLKKAASKSRSLQAMGPMMQRIRTLWYMRKEGRHKGSGGARGGGASTTRGAKDRGHANGRERADAPGRPERSAQAGKQDGKAVALHSSAPPCFVCLDRPSRYILEPCGHRVVCEECAVQLVEAAARNRGMSDAAGSAHHTSDRGGGA